MGDPALRPPVRHRRRLVQRTHPRRAPRLASGTFRRRHRVAVGADHHRHRPGRGHHDDGATPRRAHPDVPVRAAGDDVRQPDPRRDPQAAPQAAPAVGPDPAPDRHDQAPAGAARPLTGDHRLRPQAGTDGFALGDPVPAGHAGRRTAAAVDARGLRRDVRQVRPDRLDPHRSPPRGLDDRAGPPPVVGSASARRGDPRRRGARARGQPGRGVRVVQLRAAGGGVDRPDPPSRAAHGGRRRGQDPAPGDRGDRPARRSGAADGRRPGRATRRGGAGARRQTARRRADHLAGEGARLRR